MATIQFRAGEGSVINNLAGSGLGFYGSTFGNSVAVGEYQGSTFITNADGTLQGPNADNIKYLNAGSGYVGSQTSGVPLRYIPNVNATLNINFNHTTAVRVQNAEVRIYDRVTTTRPASGVTSRLAELQHPSTIQNNTGSGDLVWTTFSGVLTATGIALSLCPSPCNSGLRANGAGDTADTNHDWYLAISASPDSIGSKTNYGLYVSLEYL